MTATLTLPGGSEVFTFLTARTDAGSILNQPWIEEEPLETPGVDGMRWRTLRLRHRAFRITTVTGCATFSDAVQTAKTYLRAKGRNCSYSNNSATASFSYSNLHIDEVEPIPTAGPVIGAAASSGLLAHVITVWTVTPTNFAESDQVGA